MEEATNAKLVADWMLSITAILLVLVIAGAIYLQGRQNRFALGIDLLLDMDDRFNTPMMRVSRRKASTYLKKRGIGTGPDVSIADLEHHLDEVLDFFDQLGYFLKRGALERRAVWSAFYHQVHHWYFNAERYITSQRQLDATICKNFDYLNTQLVAEQRRQLNCNDVDPSITLSDKSLFHFLINESGFQ